MKRHEIFFGILRLPIEFFIVLVSFFVARHIRTATDLIPGIHLPLQTIKTPELFGFAFVGSLLAIIFLVARGLYRIRVSESRLREMGTVTQVMISWFFAYIGILFLANGYLYSTQIPRLIVFFATILSCVGIIVFRALLNTIHASLLQHGFLEKRKVLLILEQNDPEIIHLFATSPIYGIVGFVSVRSPSPESSLIPHLGNAQNLEHILRKYRIDNVFYINGNTSEQERLEFFETTQICGARYAYFPHAFETDRRNVEMSFLGESPFVEIRSIGLDSWGRVAKRIGDIVGSLFLGLMLSIPVSLLLLYIWISDKGVSPLYASIRVGKNGKKFTLYKIRTMVPRADKLKKELLARNERSDGPLFKMKEDPRITRLGKILRTTGIDEIPQLWNVLRGDMSLIGPRPHLPEEVAQYKPEHRRVLTIKPGITGMAQVHGRHTNNFDREVELDTLYIENWSFLLDTKILAKTVTAVFGRGA